ncbi:AraC family transcriptional regulator [Rhodoferax ferrireducens]|uniref:AraC family transcriptional regulator n=1 Tax=Rhodoferax ferrireducens TaxID=192843 RepID=UPI001E4560AE|nr:AraC family transcriptional regulator [Rhodoferax ferrireducens]
MKSHFTYPEFHAPSSDSVASYGMTAARTDVLSEVLTLIRLRGELVYTAELGAPWGIRYAPGPAHFHFVEQGTLWVLAAGTEPMCLDAGDLVLLPHGNGHVIADDPGTSPTNIDWLTTQHFNRDDLSFRFGGVGMQTKLVGGFFSFEGSPLPAIMSALPTVIHIPRVPGGAQPWLAAISHFLVEEAHQPYPGSSLMISRLIDLLVIRALRSWAAGHAQRGGWLGGLGEQRIGRALSAIHGDPFRRWTVQALADIALMSRSIFAERFVSTVGEPPLHYVTRWRMTIAADLIRSGGLKVTEAAQRVGYASDAAFSRAFKAHFGHAPSEAKR